MELRKDYEKLYQHWLNEFRQAELTILSQEIFTDYKKMVNSINDYEEEKQDDIKSQLLESYKKNINYMFKDLLKIREIKIMNYALALKEINLNNVIEAEKLFFQNLVSAIKGYKKIKKYSISEEIKDQSTEQIDITEASKKIKDEGILSKNEITKISESVIKEGKEEFNYTLIRFLKKTPPLVGIDLLNYGPFEKEDVANLPYENAKILINEKFAERIDLS